MSSEVPFRDVLDLLEENGWKLERIYQPYRVFGKAGRLPILIPVHDKMVSETYVEKIKAILSAEGKE